MDIMRKLLLSAAASLVLVASVAANVTSAEARPVYHQGRLVVHFGHPVFQGYRHHYFRPVYFRCHTQNIIWKHRWHRAEVCGGRVTRIY
jgi:hypothetical protein